MWNSEQKVLQLGSYRGHPVGGSWVYYADNRWKFGRPKFIDLMEDKEIDLLFLWYSDSKGNGSIMDRYLAKYYNNVDISIDDLYSEMFKKYKIRRGNSVFIQTYICDYQGKDTEYAFIPAPSAPSSSSKKRKR